MQRVSRIKEEIAKTHDQQMTEIQESIQKIETQIEEIVNDETFAKIKVPINPNEKYKRRQALYNPNERKTIFFKNLNLENLVSDDEDDDSGSEIEEI